MWAALERHVKRNPHVNMFIHKTIKMEGVTASIFQLPPKEIAAGQISNDFSTDIFIFTGEVVIVVGEVRLEGKQESAYKLLKGIYSFYESCFSALHRYTIF